MCNRNSDDSSSPLERDLLTESRELRDERDALLRQKEEHLVTMRQLREDVETWRERARGWKGGYLTARTSLLLVMKVSATTLEDLTTAERILVGSVINDGDGSRPPACRP